MAKKAIDDFNNHEIGEYELAKHFKVIAKALEKQIPKPLADKWEINNYINGECQKCGEILIQSSKYCSNCGQKAKWS